MFSFVLMHVFDVFSFGLMKQFNGIHTGSNLSLALAWLESEV